MLKDLKFASAKAELEARFILLEQRVLQLVEEGKATSALRILRQALTPLAIHKYVPRPPFCAQHMTTTTMFYLSFVFIKPTISPSWLPVQ
jgi:hypothetical protein